MRVLIATTFKPFITFVAGMPNDILYSQAPATEDEQIGRGLCLAVETRLPPNVYGTFLVLEPFTKSIQVVLGIDLCLPQSTEAGFS